MTPWDGVERRRGKERTVELGFGDRRYFTDDMHPLMNCTTDRRRRPSQPVACELCGGNRWVLHTGDGPTARVACPDCNELPADRAYTIILTRGEHAWVAQLIEHDIAAQGFTATDALVSLVKTIRVQILVDEKYGRAPLQDFEPCPPKVVAALRGGDADLLTMRTKQPVAGGDVGPVEYHIARFEQSIRTNVAAPSPFSINEVHADRRRLIAAIAQAQGEARAEEREACAVIVEARRDSLCRSVPERMREPGRSMCNQIAAAIRARAKR